MTNESKPRNAGWQFDRLPTHTRTILLRVVNSDEDPIQLGYFDGRKFRKMNRRYQEASGWMELADAAWHLDQIGQVK